MIKENIAVDILDAFARTFVYRTTFSKSPMLGAIGGTAFATAKAVSILTLPIFEKIPHIGRVLHQFTRGFIIRTIFTRSMQSGLVLGLTYAAVDGISTIFVKFVNHSQILEKTGLDKIAKTYGSDIYNAFWSELNNHLVLGLVQGSVAAVAKGVSLIFQKIIIDFKPLQRVGLEPFLTGFSDNYGLETGGVFIKAFVMGTILSANPILGVTNGILSVTAFHVYALYESKSKEFRS